MIGAKLRKIFPEGDALVLIVTNDSDRVLEVWLNRAEVGDAMLRGKLASLFTEYAGKKYSVAIFESGSGDLSDGMLELLLKNRDSAV